MPAKRIPWDYRMRGTHEYRWKYNGRFFKTKVEREQYRGYFLARISMKSAGLDVDDRTLMRWAELRAEDDEIVASHLREQRLRHELRKKYNITSPKIPYQYLEELESMRGQRR